MCFLFDPATMSIDLHLAAGFVNLSPISAGAAPDGSSAHATGAVHIRGTLCIAAIVIEGTADNR